MLTFASLFSGGGGADIGAKQAGLQPIWGIELESAIAEVYATNIGHQPIVKSVADVDPATLDKPDVLWLSPPCQAHSVARSKKLAARDDADIGFACLPYLETLQPQWVFLENVEGYKNAESFQAIVDCLHGLGYWTNWEVLNAADFGVPQTRRRLILRARKGGFVPPLPPERRWVGWYEAIADLIPTLPESRFAEWQLKRLPDTLSEHFLMRGDNAGQEWGKGFRLADEPTAAISVSASPKAFLVPGDNASNNTVRAGDEPMVTVQTRSLGQCPHKAFILDGKNIHPGDRITMRDQQEPTFTVTSQLLDRPCHAPKAFIVDGVGNSDGTTVTVRQQEEPLMTVAASSHKRPYRAWLEQGRVVAMTPRALARFQSFPDSYELPEKNTLACRVIGNAVPPLMAQRLLEAIPA